MLLKRLIFTSLVIFLFTSLLFAQDSSLKCPKTTKYVIAKVSSQIANKPYFPQVEEYCQKKKNNVVTKEGPYRLWGPNREKFEEGQFVNGKKDGKWKRWIPSQILEDTWSKGELIDSTVIGAPNSYTIDFRACNKHEYGIPSVFGSTSYQITGKEGNYCKLSYSREIEMGQGPKISCSVPLEKGKLVFGNSQIGIDFSIIEQFCKR